MFSSQVTFSRVTRQQVVGQLKSTNSIDPGRVVCREGGAGRAE